MINKIESLIADFVSVARLAGYQIDLSAISHKALLAPHKPGSLPKGKQAVYVFSLPDASKTVLKIGKVGANNNARFISQHYNPKSSRSNLAKSLLENGKALRVLGAVELSETNIGSWIKENVDRENFYIDSKHGLLLLSLLEVFLQCRLQPLFEG